MDRAYSIDRVLDVNKSVMLSFDREWPAYCDIGVGNDI
jgi:hypothetical protein